MRVPAAHRAMGRSIAGKRPVGNSGRDRRGRIKPNRTPNKSDPRRPSTTSTSTTSATTSTTNKQTKPTRERSRAQEVNRLRPAGVHTQWGAPGDVDGKMAGQSHILQFATAAAVCACLFLVSGAGLASVQGGTTSSSTTTTSTSVGPARQHKIPDDNSCLFHAVIHQLQLNKTTNDLRRDIARVVVEDSHQWSSAMLGKSRDEYVTFITDTTKWGGQVELNILSSIYCFEIATIDIQTGRLDNYGEGRQVCSFD